MKLSHLTEHKERRMPVVPAASCAFCIGRCAHELTSTPLFFFFNDTATTEIYTLSLHDALPIHALVPQLLIGALQLPGSFPQGLRSEEHTSELQSRSDLVCRLLLEKKKKQK